MTVLDRALGRDPFTFRFVVANIRNTPDLPKPQVLHDVRQVRGERGVIVWNEIGEPSDHAAIDHEFPPEHWYHLYRRHEIPQSISKRFWAVDNYGSKMLHRGSSRIPNPDRWLGDTLLRRRYRPPWQSRIAFLGTHWVNGAFTETDNTKAWRFARWLDDFTGTREAMLAHYRRGVTCILGGDLNALEDKIHAAGGFHPKARVLHKSGILQAWVLEAPGGVKVKVLETGEIGTSQLYTDHPVIWVHCEAS